MTPKDKAEWLVVKLLKHSRAEKDIKPIQSAKQCALIAVNELIYETQFEVPNIRQRYWIDVKQEIEKL
jgi:hypothetical protein